MVFNRQFLPHYDGFDEKALFASFAGIGMNFAANPSKDPNIKDTVLAASIDGLEKMTCEFLPY